MDYAQIVLLILMACLVFPELSFPTNVAFGVMIVVVSIWMLRVFRRAQFSYEVACGLLGVDTTEVTSVDVTLPPAHILCRQAATLRNSGDVSGRVS